MEQTELNLILEQHLLWIQSNGVQGKCANLGGADLTGADLNSANLNDAFLWGANLWGASLYRTDLTGANLTGANLCGAFFYRANLNRADLSGGDLSGADFCGANLLDANLLDANLTGASLRGANLSNAILPDISWIIPGCLVQLNDVKYEIYLKKENKYENFIKNTFGFFIQDNREEGTFDMLVEDQIIRGIPDWVKYSGLKQIASESV